MRRNFRNRDFSVSGQLRASGEGKNGAHRAHVAAGQHCSLIFWFREPGEIWAARLSGQLCWPQGPP